MVFDVTSHNTVCLSILAWFFFTFTTFWAHIGEFSMKFVHFACFFKFFVLTLMCLKKKLSAMLIFLNYFRSHCFHQNLSVFVQICAFLYSFLTFCIYIGAFSLKFVCFARFINFVWLFARKLAHFHWKLSAFCIFKIFFWLFVPTSALTLVPFHQNLSTLHVSILLFYFLHSHWCAFIKNHPFSHFFVFSWLFAHTLVRFWQNAHTTPIGWHYPYEMHQGRGTYVFFNTMVCSSKELRTRIFKNVEPFP